ncbi:hypothetical protein Vadar_008179 [Vaccinium darrowii]|uniref:Uncharacterized protein n=1 Tax=Vaccinium darrowii TaxID=229202 RepID=A0ACB7YCS6_9ERIC|nr:hypothetical protein Vadar_008179 [Vaccinium darrowii]
MPKEIPSIEPSLFAGAHQLKLLFVVNLHGKISEHLGFTLTLARTTRCASGNRFLYLRTNRGARSSSRRRQRLDLQRWRRCRRRNVNGRLNGERRNGPRRYVHKRRRPDLR